jgi:hypothetical protein
MSAARRIGTPVGVRSDRRVALTVGALVIAFAFAAGLAGAAAAPESASRADFLAAGRAYADGRMQDAARLYEGLVRGGAAPMEVFFNLGNAEARGGRIGAAVLNYRKAWRLAPRDPDIAANLRLALQATGASEADLSGAELVFTRLSQREWGVAAMAAWWATGLLVSLAILFRSLRWLLARLGALTAALTVAAVLGLWTWRGFDRAPELVVLNDTLSVLRAPQAAAPPHFSLPEGSLVRARERRGEWVRVSHGQLSGWIREASVAPVLLPTPQK